MTALSGERKAGLVFRGLPMAPLNPSMGTQFPHWSVDLGQEEFLIFHKAKL